MSDIIDGKMLRKFEVIKKIGKGAYGQVWKVFDKQTKNIMALKKIYDAFRNLTDCQRTYRQIMYLKQLKHSCIVQLINYYPSSNQKDMYVCLQFMESDLATTLKNQFLKDIHKQYIFTQIVHAVHFLHSANLIHRDIKPSNILVNANCDAKLCDFGLVRSVNKKKSQKLILTENIATRWYKAPQLLLSSNCYGKQIDIWSLGCILAQMFLGKPLFQGNSAFHQLQQIIEVTGKPQTCLKHIIQSQTSLAILQSLQASKNRSILESIPTADPLVIDLLCRIFQFDPRQRPTIQEIIQHPYLMRFKNKIPLKKQTQPLKINYEQDNLSIDQYKLLLGGKQSLPLTNELSKIDQLNILKSMKSKINLQTKIEGSKTPKKEDELSKTKNDKTSTVLKMVKSAKCIGSVYSPQPSTPVKTKISLIDKNKSHTKSNKNMSPTLSNLKTNKNIEILNQGINNKKNNSHVKVVLSPKSKIYDEKSFQLANSKKQYRNIVQKNKPYLHNSGSNNNLEGIVKSSHTSGIMGCNNSISQYEEGNTIMNRYDIKNIKVKAEGKDKKIQFESKFIKR